MVVPTTKLAAAVGKRKRGTGSSRNQQRQAKRVAGRERNRAAAKKRKTSSGAITTKRTPKTTPRQRKTPVKPKPAWTFTTVKMKLRTFCKDEGLALAWDSVLRDMNKMVAEAYMLAAVHMVRCCEEGFDIPILARSFYQQCLSAVSGGNLHHPLTTMTEEFRDSVAIYSAWRGESPIPNRDAINRGWAQVAAKHMGHETQNHLKLNFYRRFKQYITLRYGLAGRDCYLVLKGILDPEYDGDNEIVLEYRELIPRNDEGYLDQRASELLPLVHMFLTFVEDHNREHEGEAGFEMARTYSLLPTKRGFVCSHFTMSSRGLRAMLVRSGYGVPKEGSAWNAVEDSMWRRLFNTNLVETSKPDGSPSRCFAGAITTDGKSVSILVKKPVRGRQELQMSPETAAFFSTRWGLDPGRHEQPRRDHSLFLEGVLPCRHLHSKQQDHPALVRLRRRGSLGGQPPRSDEEDVLAGEARGLRALRGASLRHVAGLHDEEEVPGPEVPTLLPVAQEAARVVYAVRRWPRPGQDDRRLWGLELLRLWRRDQEVSGWPHQAVHARALEVLPGGAGVRVPHQQGAPRLQAGAPRRPREPVPAPRVPRRRCSQSQDSQCTPLSSQQWRMRYYCELRCERLSQHSTRLRAASERTATPARAK